MCFCVIMILICVYFAGNPFAVKGGNFDEEWSPSVFKYKLCTYITVTKSDMKKSFL